MALKALKDVRDAEQRARELVEKARLEGRNALQAAEKTARRTSGEPGNRPGR